MDPVVQRAEPDDVAELARLEQLARCNIADARGGALRLAECHPIQDWSALVGQADTLIFIASLETVPVGYMVLELSSARARGIITHAFVEDGARELGLGDAMVEHAIAAVRQRGLAGIEATALPGDRETKNLFERAGLTARKITVYKSLA